MAVGTKAGQTRVDRWPKALYTFVATSAANTAQTVSTDVQDIYNLLHVEVAYSAAPTQTGVTVTLNALAGAGYDTLLATGSANAQYTSYQPTNGAYLIVKGDAIDVLAPAGGVGITSAVSIYLEAI